VQPTILDALADGLIKVTDEERPRLGPTSTPALFAVFSSGNDRFLGFVTSEEIAQSPHRIFADLLPRTIPPAIGRDTSIVAALALMERENHWILPVTDDSGAFVGAVTRPRLLELLLDHYQKLSAELEEEQRQLRLWSTRLGELNQASRTLMALMAHVEGEENMAQSGINVLATLLRARYGAVGIIDENGKLDGFFVTGVSQEQIERIGRWPEGKGLLGVVVQTNQSLRLDDLTRDPRSAGFPPGHPPMKSLLAVPIADDGKVYGRVYLCDKLNGEPFSEEDEVLATTFAHSLALALIQSREQTQRRKAEQETRRLLNENRQLTRKLLKAQEEERKRVARELHDELGQYLTAMQADLAMMSSLSERSHPEIHHSAQTVEALLIRFHDTVRSLIENLRPPLLDQLGLAEALEELVNEYRSHYRDISWKLTIIGDLGVLDETLKITVYRIVQECMNNIGRHARATQAEVMVCESIACQGESCQRHFGPVPGESASVRLLIKDNGVGLSSRETKRGLGLMGVRERVEALGGLFSLESQSGQGTCVAIEIPSQARP
jgi:signal transduction histidine kinase